MRRRWLSARGCDHQKGAILLFVLFVALAIALLAQALSVAVICAERGRDAENTGRELLADKEHALLDVRDGLLTEWAAHAWSPGGEGSSGVSTMVEPISGSSDRAVDASAAHPADTSPLVLSAWVERGRDGVDLPMAGLVASSATWTGGRERPCVEMDKPQELSDAQGEAVGENRPAVWLVERAEGLPTGAGVQSQALARPWELDDGWRRVFDAVGQEETPSGLRPEPAVMVLSGKKGATVAWPQGVAGEAGEAGASVLVVVTGGVNLDADGLGDVYAVIVCNGGGVSLEGTRIHGGIFASGDVDFGSTGAVLFASDVVRWAADRSLLRARLVPGSRREVVE